MPGSASALARLPPDFVLDGHDHGAKARSANDNVFKSLIAAPIKQRASRPVHKPTVNDFTGSPKVFIALIDLQAVETLTAADPTEKPTNMAMELFATV